MDKEESIRAIMNLTDIYDLDDIRLAVHMRIEDLGKESE